MMRTETKFKIGFAAAAVIFAAAAVMFGLSIAASGRTIDLGYDISSYRITKMYTDDQTIRIAGTQEGELFAFDLEGQLLWNVGAPVQRAVYDLVMEEGTVYAVYADGRIFAFAAEAAEGFDPAGGASFADEGQIFALPESFADDGNVTNTQLIADEGVLLLRGRFRGASGARSNIYRIDPETGEALPLLGSAGAARNVTGMAADGDTLFYAQGQQVLTRTLPDGEAEVFASLGENLLALSLGETSVNVITESSNLVRLDRETAAVEHLPLSVTLNANQVYAVGEDFIGKIRNGGVAVIDAGAGAVSVSMGAADSASLIMWTADSFVLKDDADINHPVVTYYSISLAGSIALFSTLKFVSLGILIGSLLAALYLGFGIKEKYRRAVNGKFRAFGRALRKDKLVYLSMVIPVVLLIVFYYIPIVLSLGLSFFDYVPGQTLVFTGLKNIIAVVTDASFWNSALIMLVFLVADLVKAIVPPVLLAEAIFALKFKRFSLWTRILLFLPGILPGVATVMVWSSGVFGATSNSLVNAFIGLFVPGFVKNWINSAQISTQIFTLIAFGFPWVGSYLIFYGAIGGINASVFESAKLDGCGWVKRILKMDIPLILPQIKYIFITSFIASVQNYTTFYILYGFDGAIRTPALLMYREIINASYGTASVMGLLIFLFLSVATVINFRMQSDQS